jgi:hypothetical protein
MSLFDSAWSQLGAVGVVFFFVVLLATGRLVPVSTLRRELDAAVRRAEDWKEAHALERKAREIQAAKDDEILNLLRTLTAAPGREPAA